MSAYGSALLVGVALSHALTRVSLARARAAGFEMLWTVSRATQKVTRKHETTIKAELRNRDNLPTRFRDLQVAHSPGLEVHCSPSEGEIPAQGSLQLCFTVVGLRVGYHGIHNLSLQTIRAPGLHRVPLSFSNPFVIEVLPRSIRLGLPGAIGGRSHGLSTPNRFGRRNGDGSELRELRDHRPGDPYRRIAWKASARRGRLLIIEKEDDQDDLVWLLVDASVDSATNSAGYAALDRSIDQTASLADEHLAHGDRVGLAIIGSRILAEIAPGHGARQKALLLGALTHRTHTSDVDRSDWDEGDIARRVLEHLRPLDGRAAALRPFDLRELKKLAWEHMQNGPVGAAPLSSVKGSNNVLRRYLLSFGIQAPPARVPQRHAMEEQMGKFLKKLRGQRRRPSIIYLLTQAPTRDAHETLLRSLKSFVSRRTEIRFVDAVKATPTKVSEIQNSSLGVSEQMLQHALLQKQRMTTEDGHERLSRLGVVISREKRSKGWRKNLVYYSREPN